MYEKTHSVQAVIPRTARVRLAAWQPMMGLGVLLHGYDTGFRQSGKARCDSPSTLPEVRLLVGPVISVLVLASVVTISASPDAAEARKRCGKVRAQGTTVAVIVRRGAVPCRRARRIVRNNFLYAGPPVKGWFCFTAHGSPGRPPRYGGSCAPNGQDPDTARRSILIGRPRAAGAARNCDTRRFVVYALGGVTCRQARHRVRWMRSHRRGYPGYNCSSGSGYRTGAYCKRGRRVFGFHPYD